MSNKTLSILARACDMLRGIARESDLLTAEVSVLAKQLTPEEAIGTPGRRDFPIIVGKERVLEARVFDARGHAFTDSPRELVGVIDDVLALPLDNNGERAIFVATLNATLRHLGRINGTVHCRDEDPEECACEIARLVQERHGQAEVGLIGLNPAIAERLVQTFGPEHMRIQDLNADNVGQQRFGVEVWDGSRRTEELIDASDVVVLTGTTLINGTFDAIYEQIQQRNKPYLVYGVTVAGIAALFDLERVCPRARDE